MFDKLHSPPLHLNISRTESPRISRARQHVRAFHPFTLSDFSNLIFFPRSRLNLPKYFRTKLPSFNQIAYILNIL